MIDRQIFFDSVRPKPFGGKLSQSQVDGMGYILDAYEMGYADWDLRWLAYAFATTFHETSKEMQPISEYGKGSGAAYGKPDPTTGQCYYGRGYVQLTWDTNYKRADGELGLVGDDFLLRERRQSAARQYRGADDVSWHEPGLVSYC